MTNQFRDDSYMAQKLRWRIGVVAYQPRFLGMFEAYVLPVEKYKKVPVVGFLDYFVVCPECKDHTILKAVCFYVRIGRSIYSISWPTWLKVP